MKNNQRTLFTTKEAAEYLRLAPITLETWRCNGKGPDYIRMGRKVLYNKTALDKWIEENTVTTG